MIEKKNILAIIGSASSNSANLKLVEFRDAIKNSDGIIICTSEYIFSIPSGLKNSIERCSFLS